MCLSRTSRTPRALPALPSCWRCRLSPACSAARSRLEPAAAAGLQANNDSPRDGAVELSRTPILALRASAGGAGGGRLGASAIATATAAGFETAVLLNV